MNTIEEMIKDFRDVGELRMFAESQYTTIIQLSQKIAKLEEENRQLSKSVAQNINILVPNENSPKLNDLKDKSDEEVICRVQLALLKEASLTRELTMEETKKVDTYSKLLIAFASNKTKEDAPGKEFSDKDLLLSLENGA